MANPPPIEVQALWDGTKLKAGTEEAETAIEALADSVDTAALDMSDSIDRASTDMRSSLQAMDDGMQSTLGSGGTFSRGVDDAEAQGGRLSEVGTEMGAEFSSNLAEGISSGDASATVTDSATGLFATLGALGPTAAVAGVGGLLATGLVKGLADGIGARRDAIVGAVDSVVSTIAADTEASMKAVRQSILDTFSLQAGLEKFGDGSASEGLARINELADELHVSVFTFYDALQGKATPAVEDLRQKLLAAEDQGSLLSGAFTDMPLLMNDTAKNASDLTKQLYDTDIALGRAKDQTRDLLDYNESNATAAERQADAYERIAAAAERINQRNGGDGLI